MDGLPPSSLWIDLERTGHNRQAKYELMKLMPQDVFDTPKPVKLLKYIMQVAKADSDAIVLDFFAGSATTAHAVLQLNAEDGGNRRFILVQLPEPTPEQSKAREIGLNTIADIARRRVDVAGEAIRVDVANQLVARDEPLDVGYRSYSLADTSFAKWRVTSDVEANALEQHLLDLRESSSADDATADDLLIEILLKQGYSLTEKIAPVEIDGLELRVVYDSDGDFGVLAYLDEHTKPSLEQLRNVVGAGPARMIILEDALQGDDELKTNLVQLAKSKSVELWTA